MAVGEEAVVADAVKAVRQGVEQKPTDELVRVEGHNLRLAVVTIVLPAEGDVVIGDADQPGVGDRHPMGVAAEIGENLLGTTEGRFGVDHPVDAAKRAEPAGEGDRLGEVGEFAEETEVAVLERGAQFVEEQPAEQAREHAHRQQEAGPAPDQRVPSSDGPPPGTTQWTCG
jgi:hypothetical protein